MELFFIHLLKSSGILLLFLVSYYTFLKKETFFEGNRFFLGVGLIASMLLPFFTITKTVYVERAPVIVSNFAKLTPLSNTETAETFNWLYLMLLFYLTGVIFFTIRLLLQLRAIDQIKQHSAITKEEEFYHVKTSAKISPFSFFKYIFYYPFQFNKEELQTIIIHEKEHAKGLHSVDILLTEIVCILQWFNPVIWFYKIMVKQNLEFLADSRTCEQYENKKQYQYLMLKQVIGHQKITIANPFFNSLIKKRIVMLNQKQSKRINILKVLTILPLLAIFLFSFNTKEKIITKDPAKVTTSEEPVTPPLKNKIKVEELQDSVTQTKGVVVTKKERSQKNPKQSVAPYHKQAIRTIELIITKNTTDDELGKMKKDLAAKDIDFSYTVVHNSEKEIIDISLSLRGTSSDGEKFSGNYNSSSTEPIKDIFIIYDDEANMVSFSKAEHKNIHVFSGMDEIGNHEDIIIKRSGNKSVWINSNTDDMETIKIKTEDGVKKVFIDGEEVNTDEIHQNHFSFSTDDHDVRVRMASSKGKKKHKTKKGKNNVLILKDADNDTDIEVIDENDGFFFINTDGEEEPLFYIDGKEASRKKVKKLSPKEIETIDVSKGKAAIKKYGEKAKNGVVEITTKKEK